MYSDLMEEILEVAPGFRGTWERFLDRWSDEEYLPWYCAMDELADYIVDSYSKEQTEEFIALFNLVEEKFEKGDADLEELIVVGLFETLQNVASHRDFGYQVFRNWLRPRSLVAWDEIDKAMQQVAQWTAHENRRHWWQFWRRWTDFDPQKALDQVESLELKRILESEFRSQR